MSVSLMQQLRWRLHRMQQRVQRLSQTTTNAAKMQLAESKRMAETGEIWRTLNDMRERLARHEERSINRDVVISNMQKDMHEVKSTVQDIKDLITQLRGANWFWRALSSASTKLWLSLLALVGLVSANWQAVKDFLTK